MEYLLSALWICLDLISMLLFFSIFFPKKEKKHRCFCSIISWLLVLFFNSIPSFQHVSPFLRYSIFLFLSLYLFTGSWYTHALLEILVIVFVLIIDTAVSYGACSLLNVSLTDLIWDKLTYATVGTLGKLLTLFCVWLVCRCRSSYGFNDIKKKWLLLTILFPLVSVIILVLNYYNNQANVNTPVGVFLISLILAVANIGIIYLIYSLEKTALRDQEMALLKQQMLLQRENYTALETSYSLQRKASHEFERHLQALHDLLECKEYSTAESYIYQLQRNRTLRVHCINTHHPVIDVILNQKYQLAMEKEIKMQIQITDLSNVEIQPDTLVVLFSNLLDNAIEACQKLSSRKEIRCSVFCNDSLYISICNTSLPVKITPDGIHTDKANSIEHGYGIPAIKYVLEQLHAEYTFDYADGWFQFVTEIPFNLQ